MPPALFDQRCLLRAEPGHHRLQGQAAGSEIAHQLTQPLAGQAVGLGMGQYGNAAGQQLGDASSRLTGVDTKPDCPFQERLNAWR